MLELTNKKKGSLSLEDSKRIITLIKAKINPTFKKSVKRDQIKSYTTEVSFYRKPKVQIDIIDRKQLSSFEVFKNQSSIDLVRKAKKYVEERKKSFKEMEWVPTNLDLNMYMTLWQKLTDKENQAQKLIQQKKYLSGHALEEYVQARKMQGNDPNVIAEKSDDQYSEINARIRRRMNHRKIIQLYKS